MRKFNLKNYKFQIILLTFLLRGPIRHTKFHLHDWTTCALAWWCQKRYYTSHTSNFLNTSLKTIFSLLASHTPHRHEPRMISVCWDFPQYTDTKPLFTPLLSKYTLHSPIIYSRFLKAKFLCELYRSLSPILYS